MNRRLVPAGLARLANRALPGLVTLEALLLVASPASRATGGVWVAAQWLLLLATPIAALLARQAGPQPARLGWLPRTALAGAGLIALAAAVHFAALLLLQPGELVAVSGLGAREAAGQVLAGLRLHLVLPSALVALAVLAELRAAALSRWPRLLPLLLAPSAAVGVLQGLGHGNPWNVPHFARLGRASGLGYDANSLAACILLLLPLALLAARAATSRWARGGYALLAGGFVLALVLTGNRTALALTAAGLLVSPWLVLGLAPPRSPRRRLLLTIAPLLLGLLGILVLRAPVEIAQRGELRGIARVAAAVEMLGEQRTDELLSASGRRDLWLQAVRMWAAAPLAGWGPGGYGRELANFRFRSDHGEAGPVDLAASHYLQVAAELGSVGLLIHLALIGGPLVTAIAALRRRRGGVDHAALGVVACTLAAALLMLQFNHYGLFPDVAWTLAALLAFAHAAGDTAHAAAVAARRSVAPLALCAAIAAAFAVATVFVAFGPRGYAARREADWWPLRDAVGCYPSESWQGVATRWCAPQARLAVPVEWPGDGSVALSMLALHPDLAARPLAVELRTAAGRSWRFTLERPEWRRVRIPLEAAALRPCLVADGRRADCLTLEIVAARGWRPSDGGDSQDDRLLGVAVRTRALPDLAGDPRHLFSDDFESGDLARWRLGTASD